jgi:glyoxylase-like metal-dependent hydrolase (beta-lactamase superfamily II)
VLTRAAQVQRYPREWSAALKKMLALEAEMLLPGHGAPPTAAPRGHSRTAPLTTCACSREPWPGPPMYAGSSRVLAVTDD